MRTLVFRGGALGDFIVTLPALLALRQRWPGMHIELVGNRAAAELATAAGIVARVHDQHAARWTPLFNDEPLPDELAVWLRSFDRIVNFWPDQDGSMTRHLATLEAAYLAGSSPVSTAPAARQFLAPLTAWQCDATNLAPILVLPEALQRRGAERLGERDEIIAIHPGSGSPHKTWPLERWWTVARALHRRILWIRGEADGAVPPPPGITVTQADGWPLPELAAALSQCRYYLGHDTGVSHLAAAAGARGTLLFGPTEPAIWAPPTSRMTVVRPPSGRLEDLEVSGVLDTLPPDL
jgi:heptosyltransferase III